MIPLLTKRLILRNWRESDRDLFHRINSDDKVMRFFPMRRSRAESDAVMDRMRDDILRDGFGWMAAELTATGECIGFAGLNKADLAAIAPPETLEVGWRLAPEFWGFGYATEAASRLLDFAFDDLARTQVISFAVVGNGKSTAVMRRLGMQRRADFDHPRVPDTHPQLKRHALYSISKSHWDARHERD